MRIPDRSQHEDARPGRERSNRVRTDIGVHAEVGRNLRGFAHYRMQGVPAFRLRVGDYRIIYEFNVERNELQLIAVGNRREIYKKALN